MHVLSISVTTINLHFKILYLVSGIVLVLENECSPEMNNFKELKWSRITFHPPAITTSPSSSFMIVPHGGGMRGWPAFYYLKLVTWYSDSPVQTHVPKSRVIASMVILCPHKWVFTSTLNTSICLGEFHSLTRYSWNWATMLSQNPMIYSRK